MTEFPTRQFKNICVFCRNDSRNMLNFVNAVRDLKRVLIEQKNMFNG